MMVSIGSGAGGVVAALLVQWFRTRGQEADARKAEAEAKAGPSPEALGQELRTLRSEVERIVHSRAAVERELTELRAKLIRLEEHATEALRRDAGDQRDIGRMLAAVEALQASLTAIERQVHGRPRAG